MSVAAGGNLDPDRARGPGHPQRHRATSIVGAAFSTTITTTGEPAPTLTETGALPLGHHLHRRWQRHGHHRRHATAGSGGSYPLTVTATNGSGTATQAFTLTNAEAPSITSAAHGHFAPGVAPSSTVTTTGYPPPP